MGERRSERRARRKDPLIADVLAAEALIAPDAPGRHPASQVSGEVTYAGDRAIALICEEALRMRGRVERVTHGFHTWPAGLHPDAAALLLTLGSGPVLDPFCGGGTVLIESMLAGRSALGFDINTIANLVARARTAITTPEERTALRVLARKAAELALKAPPGEGDEWYAPHVTGELTAILGCINKDPLARAVFSAILIKVSQRQSDTSNQRTDEVRPPGTTATLYHKKAREFARMLEDLANRVSPGVRARVHREDAREHREDGEFGQVLTSPPYPGVYDYAPMQQLRYRWLGIDPGESMREELGSRRSFRADRAAATEAWRVDSMKWVKAAGRALVPGGRLVVVIGDGNVGGKRVDSLQPIDEGARANGLKFVARASVERWDEGLRTVRLEHGAVWERP